MARIMGEVEGGGGKCAGGKGRVVETDKFISIVTVHLHRCNFQIDQEVSEVRWGESEA